MRACMCVCVHACVCAFVCVHVCVGVHIIYHFGDFYFQNKRVFDPPARKRVRIDELRKGDSWRSGGRDESQVGQMFFYLLAVQLNNIKKKRHPHPVLGLFIEGNEVRINIGCSVNGIILLLQMQVITSSVLEDKGKKSEHVCISPSP